MVLQALVASVLQAHGGFLPCKLLFALQALVATLLQALVATFLQAHVAICLACKPWWLLSCYLPCKPWWLLSCKPWWLLALQALVATFLQSLVAICLASPGGYFLASPCGFCIVNLDSYCSLFCHCLQACIVSKSFFLAPPMPPWFVVAGLHSYGMHIYIPNACCSLCAYIVLGVPLSTIFILSGCVFAMAQWKVEDLLQEVDHLVQLQKKPRAKNLMDKMVNSLEQKFQNIQNMTPGIALQLMDAVDDSQLQAESKERLLTVLDQCQGPQSNLRITNCQQSIVTLPSYLSANDWAKLDQTTVTRDIFQVLVDRLKQLGFVSMKENVKGQAVAIAMHWMDSKGIPVPKPWPLYFLVQDFSTMFADCKTKCLVGSLASYPSNPLDLGEEWIKKTYHDEQPACKDVPIAMYLAKIPLRTTSHLLKDQGPRPRRNAVATPQQMSLVPVPWMN